MEKLLVDEEGIIGENENGGPKKSITKVKSQLAFVTLSLNKCLQNYLQ